MNRRRWRSNCISRGCNLLKGWYAGELISQGNTQIYDVVKEAGLDMGLLGGDAGASASNVIEGLKDQGAQVSDYNCNMEGLSLLCISYQQTDPSAVEKKTYLIYLIYFFLLADHHPKAFWEHFLKLPFRCTEG